MNVFTVVVTSLVFLLTDPSSTPLTITVEGLESQEGQLIARLFVESNHMDPPGDYEERVDLSEGSNEVVFGEVAKGAYSIFVWHDENGNGEVDRNLIGVPKEKIGFSNNPRVRFRTPSFEATKVVVAGATKIDIQLIEF